MPHTSAELDKMRLHTKDSIMESLAALAAAKAAGTSNTQMKKLEQEYGWSEPTGSILYDASVSRELNPVDQTCFDWHHVYLVNGIFNEAVAQPVRALKPHGVGYSNFHDFMHFWHWPRRLEGRSVTGKSAFSPKRAKSSWKAETFHSGASESMSLYPVLAHFVRTILLPAGIEAAACNAFLALCLVLDLLMVVNRGIVSATRLRDAVIDHLRQFAATHGEDAMTPKFHYSIHLYIFLRIFRFLVGCLLHERKHRLIKRYLQDAHNTPSTFDASILRECTVRHMTVLKHNPNLFSTSVGLVPPLVECKAEVRQWFQREFGSMPKMAASCRYSRFATASRGDVVAVRDEGGELEIGRLLLLVQFGGEDECMAVLHKFVLAERHGTYVVCRTAAAVQILIFINEILETLIWTEDGGSLTALLPYPLQT